MLALLASCGSIKVPKAENALLYYGKLGAKQSSHHCTRKPASRLASLIL